MIFVLNKFPKYKPYNANGALFEIDILTIVKILDY